jgi:O-antigen biosynthesis protein
MSMQTRLRANLRTARTLARKSLFTVRYQGLRALYAKARRRLLPAVAAGPTWNQTYASEATMLAHWLDCTPADVASSQSVQEAHRGSLEIRTITWYLPHFENAYYGGVHTILRFAAGFARNHGVRHTFAILGDANSPDQAVYAQRISEPFSDLAGSQVVVIHSDIDLPRIPECDACVATLWSTAYYVLKNNRTKRKFYFLQDFEPMFYPAGSSSALAEATYRFGFYGLTNTVTLQEHYINDYGGAAGAFHPCVDTSIFYPPAQRDWNRKPYKVFFYGRPNHWRNGFELGAIALRKLKEQLGTQVQIVSAGHAWNPAEFGLEGIVEPLGLLSYHATTELYRTCDAGLVMMFTRHPSYLPFEFMASGCLVVTNLNHSTSWLLKDGQNCLLTLPTASCIADTLARGLQDHGLRQQITGRALEMIRRDYADWSGQVEQIYEYMRDPDTHTARLIKGGQP